MMSQLKQFDRYTGYSTAVNEHWLMELEYRAYRAKLAEMLMDLQDEKIEEARRLVELLLERAKWQEGLYRDYLCVPRMACLFRTQANEYRRSLGQDPVQVPADATNDEGYVSNGIAWAWRDAWARWFNILRLTLVRIRRFLNTLAQFINSANFKEFMRVFEMHCGFVFAYAAWVAFIPRLVFNFGIIAKHLVVPQGKESEIALSVRLWIQFERRWNEIVNDVIWFSGGLLSCFVLTAPMQTPFLAILQCCDLANSIVRTCVEMNRAYYLLSQYAPSDPMYNQIQQHVLRLEENRWRDMKNFTGLLIGVALMLPVFAFAPWAPLLGTVIVLAVTAIRIYWMVYDNERQSRLSTNKKITDNLKLFPPAPEHLEPVEQDIEIGTRGSLNAATSLPTLVNLYASPLA